MFLHLLMPLVSALQLSPPTPTNVAAFGVVEFSVEGVAPSSNPFETEIDGVFTHGQTRLVLPAFWDGKALRLRFCPPESGEWTLTVGGERRTFRVAASREKGFVRRSTTNPRYLALGNGETFVPLGLNLCWPDERGLASYDARFAKLRSVGGNFARLWTTQERALESKRAGFGRIDLENAVYYDDLFRLAAKHGIRAMWTLDDYRVLAKTDFFNAHWDKSPYNSANGGPLKEPNDFFVDPEARSAYRRKLRYVVARYAAFTSLAAWELWNEQDHIPKPGVPLAWFREMTGFVRELDPYRRLVTTSYSWDDKAEVWESPALDLVQRHLYGQGDTVDFVGEIVRNAEKLDRYGKPRLIGEFGITWREPDIALDKGRKGTPLHDALWASIMTGDAGGALTWWWDNYLEPLDLWPVFTGLSRYFKGIDFAHRDFRPLLPSDVRVKGLTALGLQDSKTGETLLWLHDPASNWPNDAKGVEPREWRDVQIVLPARRPVRVEFWDTRTGEIVSRAKAAPKEGEISVTLPPFRRDIAIKMRRV